MPLTHPVSLPWAPSASRRGHLRQEGRNWTLGQEIESERSDEGSWSRGGSAVQSGRAAAEGEEADEQRSRVHQPANLVLWHTHPRCVFANTHINYLVGNENNLRAAVIQWLWFLWNSIFEVDFSAINTFFGIVWTILSGICNSKSCFFSHQKYTFSYNTYPYSQCDCTSPESAAFNTKQLCTAWPRLWKNATTLFLTFDLKHVLKYLGQKHPLSCRYTNI